MPLTGHTDDQPIGHGYIPTELQSAQIALPQVRMSGFLHGIPAGARLHVTYTIEAPTPPTPDHCWRRRWRALLDRLPHRSRPPLRLYRRRDRW